MNFFGFGGNQKPKAGFLEGFVSDLLQPVLGAFVRGFDKDNLELSMWDGDVRLHGLELRTEVLNALPLPTRVIGGSLGEVRVSIPWHSFFSGEDIVIHIDRVLLLLAPKTAEEDHKPLLEHSIASAAEVPDVDWTVLNACPLVIDSVETPIVHHTVVRDGVLV